MALAISTAGAADGESLAPSLRIPLVKEISERIRRPFLGGMAILLIAGLGSYFALQRYRLTSLQVAYSDMVMVQLNDLLANLDRAETAERGYLTSTNPSTGIDLAVSGAIRQNLALLQRAANNGELPERDFKELAAQVNARLKFFEQLSEVRLNQGEAAATAMFTAGPPDGLSGVIHDRVAEMNAAQERRLATRLVSEHLFSRLLGTIVVVGCILAFASIAFAGHFVDSALRLITKHLTEDARGREALSALNSTLEERINERTTAAAQSARELEQVRKEAHQQERILQAVLDFIAEGVLVCDTHMRLFQTNAAAERLLGEGFGGQSLDQLPGAFEMIDTASGEPLEAAQWPLALAVRGKPCRLDFHLRDRQSGAASLIESQSTPIRDENGAVRAAIGIVRDTTALMEGRRASKLLETIAAWSDDALITLGREGKVLSWNPGAVRMFGYTPEEIIGHASRRIVSNGALATTREVSRRMLEGGAPERFEIEAVRKDGSPLPIMVAAFPMCEVFGQNGAFMLMCRDLSQGKALQAEAINAHAEAVEAARLHFDFLISMSRDVRGTLNQITDTLAPLLESPLAAVQREQLRKIAASTESTLQTVNEILDLASLAAGKVEFEQSEFDLYEVVEGAVDVAAEWARDKDLELVLTMGPDLPRRVAGDRHRVAQVLATLLESSVRFNDRGEVVLSVDREARTGADVGLRFELRGTGTRTPAELEARLIQSFPISDYHSDRESGGSGLGPAIAAQLVERMGGGIITVSGEPGHGSVIRFILRFGNASGDVRPSVHRTAPAGCRILVVDDNAANRVGVCGQLAKWGFSSDSAIGGAEALMAMRQRAASRTPYDLALIDMRMPGMDGFALVRAIRADPRLTAARLVMMGPYGVPEQPDTDAWLIKPIKPTHLLDCLVRLGGAVAGTAPSSDGADRGLPYAGLNGESAATLAAADAFDAPNGGSSFDSTVLEAMRALSGGKAKGLIRNIVKSFIAELPGRLETLAEAAAAEDSATLHKQAATLHALAASFGLTRMGVLCARLAVKNDQAGLAAAAPLMDALREEAARVITLLENEIAEPTA
jgi:PAS domain S-box-containing protein